VGALLGPTGNGWVNFCTGTLVAPSVVLTAAHCVSGRRSTISPDDVRFGIGTDMTSPLASIEVEAVYRHSSYANGPDDERYDFGVLVLAEPADEYVPSIIPIGVNRASLSSALEGQRGQVGGFGQTHPNDDSNRRKFWTTEEIVDVSSIGVAVDGNGTSAVCFGDSGGPLFRTFPDGAIRTIGVLSWGDESCLDVDHFARIDAQLAWIEGVAGPLPDPGSVTPDAGTPDAGTPDAGTPDAGTPDAGTPDAGTPDAGTPDAGTPDAGTPDAGTPDSGVSPGECGSLTYGGTCADGIAIWCDDGAIQALDCGRCGQRCAFAGASVGFFCVD